MLVKAGAPVDKTIESLVPYLEPGDILIDGGNEWYEKSIQRTRNLEEKGILFVSMGVSGGEIGARHGPSLMPGGDASAWPEVEPLLKAIAARVEGDILCSVQRYPGQPAEQLRTGEGGSS